MDESRNGRVTSSTGNLANLRDDVQDSPRQMIRDSPVKMITVSEDANFVILQILVNLILMLEAFSLLQRCIFTSEQT